MSRRIDKLLAKFQDVQTENAFIAALSEELRDKAQEAADRNDVEVVLECERKLIGLLARLIELRQEVDNLNSVILDAFLMDLIDELGTGV